MNKTKLNQWLVYYRNSLAEADRKCVQVSTDPILVETYNITQVPEKHASFLWNSSKDKENEESLVPVDISPCSYQTEFEHAKEKDKETELVYPFWIPAKMSKDGKLFPNGKPFFVRDYLSPNPSSYYTISSIKKVDECLQKFEFNPNNWVKYWSDCEKFFESVTNKKFDEYNLEYEKKLYVQKAELRNLSNNILNLYKNLLESSHKHILINKLLGFENIIDKPSPSNIDYFSNPLHLGQMNENFPLSVSQRQSMCVYNQIKRDEILAVNGPPGTGKTTLLQSVLANSLVNSVSENKAPELIIACSTNNQAITNILDSFALESKSTFTNRWLPNLNSLGLYFSSKVNPKYQTCTSYYGDGFIADYESSDIKTKNQYFLEQYTEHFGEEDSIETCKRLLQAEVKQRVINIERHLLIAQKYEENKEILKSLHCSNIQDLENKIEELADSITNEEVAQTILRTAEGLLHNAKIKRPIIDKLFYFLTQIKKRRASAYQRALLELKLTNTTNFSNYSALTHQINNLFIESSQRKSGFIDNKTFLETKFKVIIGNSDKYFNIISEWDEKYGDKLTNLHNQTGDEYKKVSSLEDMSIRLDLSFRSEAFWLAIHCREAEYLIKWQEATNNSSSLGKERLKDTYRSKLQRIACLAPIFISTFHSLPRYSSYFLKGETYPYYELFDLLIVDEAGQVSPDVSIPSFSLAKKAIVVGDIFQIEPVWSVVEKIDSINLESNNLKASDISEQENETLINTGMLCSSGNLMKLAQNACSYSTDGNKGTLLREHRRCLDSIISYSNRYVYNNQLLPKKGDKHSIKHNLPSKGFYHINGESKVEGTSRKNLKDAKIIARWIEEKCIELESAYRKKIHEIIAVVTPYKSQAYTIKKELLAIDGRKYAKLITGTVHALQGAEMEIVIFSSVLSKDDNTSFVNKQYNMLNVAVSRAKHSFLVFGNMNVLDATKNNPLGNLKKWILENEHCELSNKMVFESDIIHNRAVKRINKLNEHIGILKEAFEKAKSELIIVSPFISINAIESDSIIQLAKVAIERGVKITVFTDSKLDVRNGTLKESAFRGRDILVKNGISLKLFEGIHNKTLIVDDSILVEGSFNWLSAVRDETNPFFRLETSIVLRGEEAKANIIMAKKDLKLN